MRRPLTPRERRIGAWLLLAALLAACYSLLVVPLIVTPLRALDTQIQALGEQRLHYERLLAQRQTLEAGLHAAEDDAVGLLEGDDPSAVAADLMQSVAQRIKDNASLGAGCQLTQRMPIVVQDPSPGPFRQVRLSLDLDCAIEPLATLLQQLEAEQPLLFVDEISIHRANNAPLTGGPGRLDVHLLVSGYLVAAPPRPSVDEAAVP